VSLLLGYAVFCALAFVTGLDADDRLITNAILSRVRLILRLEQTAAS